MTHQSRTDSEQDDSGTAIESRYPATGGQPANKPEEIGGPRGPEPTRYGDWEKAGRCIDF